MKDRDKFSGGGMEEAIRVNRDFAYARFARRDAEERREADASPWIRSGDYNVMKQDSLPKPARPMPSHPRDRQRYGR